MTPEYKPPKSNTWVVLTPTLLWFGFAFLYCLWWQEPTEARYDYLVGCGLGIPFLATALAQRRSGYFWRNKTRGNRGEHRSKHPKRFTASVAGHLVIGFAIVLLCLLFFVKDTQKDDTPSSDNQPQEHSHQAPLLSHRPAGRIATTHP